MCGVWRLERLWAIRVNFAGMNSHYDNFLIFYTVVYFIYAMGIKKYKQQESINLACTLAKAWDYSNTQIWAKKTFRNRLT